MQCYSLTGLVLRLGASSKNEFMEVSCPYPLLSSSSFSFSSLCFCFSLSVMCFPGFEDQGQGRGLEGPQTSCLHCLGCPSQVTCIAFEVDKIFLEGITEQV
eukprot:jgi/Botrbrau1/14881/Bobra.0298s0013.1